MVTGELVTQVRHISSRLTVPTTAYAGRKTFLFLEVSSAFTFLLLPVGDYLGVEACNAHHS